MDALQTPGVPACRRPPNQQQRQYRNGKVPHTGIRYPVVGHIFPKALTVNNKLLDGPPGVVEHEPHGYLDGQRQLLKC